MNFWKDLIDVALHAVEIAAIVIGGWWTYFNFVRGRTYNPKLAIDIRATVYQVGTTRYLDILVVVKNIGRSKVDVSEKGTALIISEPGLLPPHEDVLSVVWQLVGTYEMLNGGPWIEPDEKVGDRLLVVLPTNDPLVYKVEARVESKSTVWKASTIVPDFRNKLLELGRESEGGPDV